MRYNYFALLLCFMLIASDAIGQKTVSELPAAHSSALQEFLTKHADLEFLPETSSNREILSDMRKSFGARFKPFYRTGDFNLDGMQDFAMILVKKGGPTGSQGADIAETHRQLYDLTIVIFNGARGGYNQAFVKTTKAPLAAFLNLTNEKRKRLTFGVYETDEGFTMTPAGKSYVIK